jgi:hypothetical protein
MCAKTCQNETAGLTARQRRFVACLVSSRTVEEAAAAAGVSRRTAHRWLTLAPVRAALAQALDDMLSEVTAQAVGAMGEALGTLIDLHKNAETPPAVRNAAARTIFTETPALRREYDLGERVGRLERLQRGESDGESATKG